MFIVIEGVDGSGKATQTANLAKLLRSRGKRVATFSFPSYDDHSSYFVRQFLQGSYGGLHDVDPYVAATFYALDRFDQAQQLRTLIADNDYVICDRYTTATLVHRGTEYLNNNKQDELRAFFDRVIDFEFTKCTIPVPDQVFFLALHMQNISSLIEKKKAETRDYIDHDLDIAEEDLTHQAAALEVGLTILPEYFAHYTVVNCEDDANHLLPADSITERLIQLL